MDIDDREVSACGLADTNQAGGKRRRWPEALKREVVAALLEPGASVSIVARRYDVNANQLFKWRRQFAGVSGGLSTEPLRLLPVEIAPTTAQMAEVRRAEVVPVLEAVGTWPLHLAVTGGWCRDDLGGSACLFTRRY